MDIDDYPALLDTFMAAKSARTKALSKARAKVNKANDEYSALVASAPESVAYEAARVELTKMRRWASAAKIPLIYSQSTEGE